VKKISLPVRLVIVLLFVFIFGSYVNKELIRVFYTFSLAFKELLSLFLPFIVFFFIAAGILSFKKNAAKVLFFIMTSIILSNTLVAMFTYGVSCFTLSFITKGIDVKELLYPGDNIKPFFKLPALSDIVSLYTLYIMLLALAIGLILSFTNFLRIEKFIQNGKKIVENILNKGFIPFIPVYVIGFLLEIKYRGGFMMLFQSYGKAFALMVLMHWVYLFMVYVVASGFNISEALLYIKTSMASYLTAFSTMSSTATIPVTTKCAEQNTGNAGLAAVASPIMANVHLIGDGISTPILSLVSMSIFLGFIPGIEQYLKFVFYFCLTMLATSGVPGGGVIAVIPVLKSVLGFTPEMVSVMLTLYFLQDSFGTAANVMGDGALMIIVNKWLKRFKIF